MARDRIVGRGAGLRMVLSLVALVLACRGKEPAPEAPPPGDTPPAAAEAPTETTPPATGAAAASSGLPTDEELVTYVTWLRDWRELTLRSKAELDAVTEQAAAKLSFGDTDKIAQDPDVLACIARTRRGEQGPLRLEAQGQDHGRDAGDAARASA